MTKAGRASATLIPLYQQISETLIRDIASGRLVSGDRLPPERELATQFDTTVRTLRKALNELEKNGMLERVHGSGNYIRSSTNTKNIYSMFRLELPQGGGLPTAQLLSSREVNKPVGLPQFGTSNRGTRIRRLRSLDKKPVAVEEIWLDRDSGEIDPKSLGDSLYRYYQVKLKFWIQRAEDQVSVAELPDWAPDNFNDNNHRVFGYIERLSWAQQNYPVEFSKTWFDPIKARYVQRLA